MNTEQPMATGESEVTLGLDPDDSSQILVGFPAELPAMEKNTTVFFEIGIPLDRLIDIVARISADRNRLNGGDDERPSN